MYKKESEPVRSLLDFSLFVTFFPHLVAGPIVRPTQLVPQFETQGKQPENSYFEGLFLLSLGLFMKVVLADSMLSNTADTVFNAKAALQPLDAWAGVLAFTGQIFFDFAGLFYLCYRVLQQVLVSYYHKTLRSLMQQQGSLTSGADGISLYHSGCVIIYTSIRWQQEW